MRWQTPQAAPSPPLPAALQTHGLAVGCPVSSHVGGHRLQCSREERPQRGQSPVPTPIRQDRGILGATPSSKGFTISHQCSGPGWPMTSSRAGEEGAPGRLPPLCPECSPVARLTFWPSWTPLLGKVLVTVLSANVENARGPCSQTSSGQLATVVISATSLLHYLTLLLNSTRACGGLSPKENQISQSHGFDTLLIYLIHGNKYMIIKVKKCPPTCHPDPVSHGPHAVPGKTPDSAGNSS